MSSGTCQQFVADAVKISNICDFFLTFKRYCSNILQVKWKSLWFVHSEFSDESISERIVKIDPHLPKLLTTIKWLTFLRLSVNAYVITSVSETIRKPPLVKAAALKTKLNTKKIKNGEKRFSTWRMGFLHHAMWHDHDIDFARWLHPAMWHVALESWQWIHQVATSCNVIRGSGMTCHWIRPNVRHIGILHLVSISISSPQSTCHSAPVSETLSKSDHAR